MKLTRAEIEALMESLDALFYVRNISTAFPQKYTKAKDIERREAYWARLNNAIKLITKIIKKAEGEK